MENNLQLQIEEREKSHSEELIGQRDKLSKVIAEKEQEQTRLTEQLEETRVRIQEEQSRGAKAENEVMHKLENLMETELICSICSEMLIKVFTIHL